ncbi:hypothetical protein [Streptomyces sp. NPDC059278]|uniref:hypothetical protein n=1 Tax=Streptomyces sp. NPDC059278 TaxID=3346801 RepID=UPI0036C59151
MQLNLYATAPAPHGGYETSGNVTIERKGDYTEHLYLGGYTNAALALEALYRADEKQTHFYVNRGWYGVPPCLAHELWLRDTHGIPCRVVARISCDTLTAANDFVRHLPGGELSAVTESFTEHTRLITGKPPIRTSRLRSVITPGGHLLAEGA